MGGFGAMRNGLKYHDTFGAIISLSGVLHMFEKAMTMPRRADTDQMEGIFGDLEKAANSDNNPVWLAEKLAGGSNLPDIYIACGTQDWLIEHSRKFRDLLQQKDFRVTYEEGPGEHNWDFWDTYIKKALDWLPLEERSQGINSGNVHKE